MARGDGVYYECNPQAVGNQNFTRMYHHKEQRLFIDSRFPVADVQHFLTPFSSFLMAVRA